MLEFPSLAVCKHGHPASWLGAVNLTQCLQTVAHCAKFLAHI